ncbi:MAG: tRNA (N6-threonylcarbamoyladenosine(37)-N6)-methyltransferase TrmO [Blautia sp.]|nr:tRNA (N6-threonylcarbamoyladenosine(37)-N6)-methyltransferase TrmO [Clostridia bacterium]MDY4694313.1 tRNA (N6-threonylcarbamoyladenosine(37)-N6)-methyltransferase TrmO [Blautia sp.]MDY5555895.1 tRNA (N6-threonylcarbamoyladenosine(37)-N6)-methyltransferase TrmO [Blautia sp.]
MKAIAHIENDFPTKFGIPRQSGRISELKAKIVFEPEFRNPDAFRGLEEYSHIWLIWEFSENVSKEWMPLVRPPRLGGNVKKGVFATRSPIRPNPLGLSCVKLDRIAVQKELGTVLYVSGADLMDGTPIFDVKPYVPYSDCHPEASGSFPEKMKDHKLQVEFPQELLMKLPEKDRKAVLKVLADDPRPGYQHDVNKRYGMPFGKKDIHFTVEGNTLKVFDVTEFEKNTCKF